MKRLFAILFSAILIFHPTWVVVAYASNTEETEGAETSNTEDTPEPDASGVGSGQAELTEGTEDEEVEQGEENPETPQNPETLQETSSNPTPTETPSSSIETGDADSEAATETTANYHETCPEGEIEIGDCEGEGEVECSIGQENDAEVDSSSEASSTSGENISVEPDGTVGVDTGSSTSEAATEDVVNTNIVELSNAEDTEVDNTEGTEGAEDSNTEDSNTEETEVTEGTENIEDPDQLDELDQSEDEEDSAVIVHNNEAEVDSSASAESTSGENEAEGEAGASVETDESHASANLVDLINTNIVGSNFEFIFEDIEDYEGDINLNEIWKALLAEKGAEASATLFSDFLLLIANFNEAKVAETVEAKATSGDNTAISKTGPAEVESGDSFASANLFRFINTNIVGSDFLFAVLNIFGDLTGNIVLPNQERFMEMNGDFDDLPPIIFTNNNFAQIDDQVLAAAISGENDSQTTSDQETETGQALAQANSINFANTNLYQAYWYWLFLNNFGDWQGEILGWEQADSSEEPESGAAQLTVNNNQDHQEGGEELTGSLNNADSDPSLAVYNENWAEIEGWVSAEARSGGNRAESLRGDTRIKTGRSIALANLFSWVNTNILGGRFILPIINIFGHWGGNLVVAHPDLVVGLSDGLDRVYPGDILDYTLVYANQGYEEARNASVRVDLPAGVSYLVTKEGPGPSVNGSSLTYSLGNLGSGQGGSFIIQVQVDDDFVEKNGYGNHPELVSGSQGIPNQVRNDKGFLTSLLAKIIRPVNAAEEGTEYEVSFTAEVNSTDADSNPDNNFVVSKTKVFVANEEGQEGQEGNNQENQSLGGPDTRMPAIYVSSWNNVGEFVYPEDIVTFEVNLVNRGDGPASETVVYQEVYNGDPLSSFTNSFYIGDLEINQSIKLSFGLQVPAEIEPGLYYSRIWAVGRAPGGDEVFSGDSLTNFKVNLRQYGVIKDVQAAEPVEGGDVAGSQVSCSPCEEKKDPLPYILLLLITSLWFTDRFKRKENKKDIRKAIKSFKGRFWKKIK